MISFTDLLWRMKNNPEYSKYYEISRKFVDYLRQVEFLKVCPKGQYPGGSLTDDEGFFVVHRFSETWFKAHLSKMYLLDGWYLEEKPDYTLLTATVSSKDRTIWETFELITIARKQLFDLFTNRIFKEKFDYIWWIRPHKNGYPHLHIIIFRKISIDDQIKLRYLWEKKGLGSFEHGLDFEVTENTESIRSLRNYCISYMTDSFVQTSSKYGQPDWNLGTLAFNAIAWDKNKPELIDVENKHHIRKKRHSPYRFWGCSRNLSKIMKYDPDNAYGGEDFSSVFEPGFEPDFEPPDPLSEEEIALMTPETFLIELHDDFDKVCLGTVWRAPEEKLIKVREKFEKYKDEIMSMGDI